MPPTDAFDDELELGDYLKILRRRWLWILVPTLLVTALAALFTLSQPLRYRATASVLLDQSAAQDAILGEDNVFTANRALANEINLAESDRVRSDVETALGGPADIIIERSDDSDLLLFTGTGATAEEAADVANTYSAVYIETKQSQAADSISAAVLAFEQDLADRRAERQELRQPLDDLEDRLALAVGDDERARLQAQVDRLKADLQVELNLLDNELSNLSSAITNLQVAAELARAGTAGTVNEAFPPQVPSNAPISRNLVLGAIVGLILGTALALVIDNLDRSIKSSEDLTAAAVPVLGLIPKPGREIPEADIALATMNHTGSPVADGYQKVRTAVEFALLGRKIKSLLITSPNPSEGKTSTSCNLAWAMSAVDHRVVLADVDFRRPRVHKVFGCSAEPGLSDNLLHGTPLNQLALRVDDQRSNMVIIPTGVQPPSPGDFVASPAFSDLLRNLEAEADLVILDAPPVLPVSDALSIARQVDAVIVVARAGETSRQDLVKAVDGLRGVGADVLGVCLIGAKPESSNYSYGAVDERRGRRSGRTNGRGPDPADEWELGENVPVGRGSWS